MENETMLEAEGPSEKQPETIGEALKKYYEEQLTHASVNVMTGRMAMLNNIFAQHFANFN